MKRLFNIAIGLIILTGIISCTTYESHIQVLGAGYLWSESNTNVAKDHLSAHGDQTYDRYYMDKDNRELFVSKYNLSSSDSNGHTYAISSMNPGSSTHLMKLSSRSIINTTNWIERNATDIATGYRATTDGGLTEMVANIDNIGKPKFMSDIEAAGFINFVAGLNTNTTAKDESNVADQVIQIQKLESVAMPTEAFQIEKFRKKGNLNFDGESLQFAERINETVQIGDGVWIRVNKNASSPKQKPDEMETLKKRAVSSVREIEGFPIITMNENVHELLAEIGFNPSRGIVGTVVNISINLTNYGKPELNQISAICELPRGMTYLNSYNGTYNNGYVKWTGIRHMNGNQKIVLPFKAIVDEKAIGQSVLNFTVTAIGSTSTSEIKRDEDSNSFIIEKSRPVIELEQISDRTNVFSGDQVVYSVTIRNPGNIELNEVSMDAQLDKGMVLVGVSPYEPDIIDNLRLYWKDIGPIDVNSSKKLTLILTFDGSNENGAPLNMKFNAKGKDVIGELATATNSSVVHYFNASASNESNGAYAGPITLMSNPVLGLLSVPAIAVDQTANDSQVYPGDHVTYNISVRNMGDTTLNKVSIEAQLDEGMVFAGATLSPNNTDKGLIQWQDIGPIEINGMKNLKCNIAIINLGDKVESKTLHFNLSAKGKDNQGVETAPSRNNSSIDYYYGKPNLPRATNPVAQEQAMNTLVPIGEDITLIYYNPNDTEISKQKLLTRNTTHLGRPLIWQRHIYQGWVEPRRPDEYFAIYESDINKTKTKHKLIVIP